MNHHNAGPQAGNPTTCGNYQKPKTSELFRAMAEGSMRRFNPTAPFLGGAGSSYSTSEYEAAMRMQGIFTALAEVYEKHGD